MGKTYVVRVGDASRESLRDVDANPQWEYRATRSWISAEDQSGAYIRATTPEEAAAIFRDRDRLSRGTTIRVEEWRELVRFPTGELAND